MTKLNKPNTAGLIVYLEKFGIDAARVMAGTVDEDGYDYITVMDNGRPLTSHNDVGELKLVTERKAWPEGVWPKVGRLIAGEGLEAIGE